MQHDTQRTGNVQINLIFCGSHQQRTALPSLCTTPFNSHISLLFLMLRSNTTMQVKMSLQGSERFYAMLQQTSYSSCESGGSPTGPGSLRYFLPGLPCAAGWKCPFNSKENPAYSKSFCKMLSCLPSFHQFLRSGQEGWLSPRIYASHTPLGKNTSSSATLKRGQRFFCVLFLTRAKHAPGQFY